MLRWGALELSSSRPEQFMVDSGRGGFSSGGPPSGVATAGLGGAWSSENTMTASDMGMALCFLNDRRALSLNKFFCCCSRCPALCSVCLWCCPSACLPPAAVQGFGSLAALWRASIAFGPPIPPACEAATAAAAESEPRARGPLVLRYDRAPSQSSEKGCILYSTMCEWRELSNDEHSMSTV